MVSTYFKAFFLLSFLASSFSSSLFATEITGAGASFPAPVYAKWAAAYQKAFQIRVNYQSIGSGGGIKQIEAKTIDFGATDLPLKPEELKKYGLSQFPTLIGGVVPIANLDGISSGPIRLTGPVLAEIFRGTINKWNDAKIQQLNPNLQLADKAITVVHRADGSGTTFLFSSYLSEMSQEWQQQSGANTTVAWPVGIGGKGNEGVSSYVQRIKGAIAYVEYAYALQNRLTTISLQNKAGEFVQPSIAAFKEAADTADWANSPGFAASLINQEGKQAWPITGASFILLQKTQPQGGRGKEVLQFIDWAYKHGDKLAESLFYVPLPDSLIRLIEEDWKINIKDTDNKPLW